MTPPVKRRGYCACGRGTNTAGPCRACREGRPPPRPDVKTLPLEYLVACASELQRRRDEINEVLSNLGRVA